MPPWPSPKRCCNDGLLPSALYGGSSSDGWTTTTPSPLNCISQLSPVLPRGRHTDDDVTAAFICTARLDDQPITASASAKQYLLGSTRMTSGAPVVVTAIWPRPENSI